MCLTSHKLLKLQVSSEINSLTSTKRLTRLIIESVRPVSQAARQLMTQSSQFSDPLDCSWLSYPDSLGSPWLNWNSLPPWKIDIWCQPQCPVVRLTLLYLGTAWSFILPIVPWHILKPWGNCPEEQETNPSSIPPQTLHFFFKNSILAFHQGCSHSRLSPPVSAASNKGTGIRSPRYAHLYFSCISNNHELTPLHIPKLQMKINQKTF